MAALSIDFHLKDEPILIRARHYQTGTEFAPQSYKTLTIHSGEQHVCFYLTTHQATLFGHAILQTLHNAGLVPNGSADLNIGAPPS